MEIRKLIAPALAVVLLAAVAGGCGLSLTGLVLNALVQARILEAEPALATLSPADLPNGRVRLKDGCWFGEPASLRIR